MTQAAEDTIGTPPAYVAFVDTTLLARGPLARVAEACKREVDRAGPERLAIFNDETGRVLDLDLSGSVDEVRARFEETSLPASKKRGRPKLGVVSREVSLLPRHWDWLAEQRGGASASIRRLVDGARKHEPAAALAKRAIEAAHHFLWDMAGDETGFEEATRHLFAHRFDMFEESIATWPKDVREQLARYVHRARAATAIAPSAAQLSL